MGDWPQIWITDEPQPRPIIVKGISAVDSDCLVAHFDGDSKPMWIIRHSGKLIRRDEPLGLTARPRSEGGNKP